MGGTEIYKPLEYAINMRMSPNYQKKIFLLTDGKFEKSE
jgi:uncharacterized protein with von Willebrand factor type A (vWA) domain